MCPLCISTVVWIAAGAGSAGGVTALVVRKLRARDERPTTESSAPNEEVARQDEAA